MKRLLLLFSGVILLGLPVLASPSFHGHKKFSGNGWWQLRTVTGIIRDRTYSGQTVC